MKAKTLVIEEIELTEFAPPSLTVRVVCSKGTYIRALARDIGKALGSGAHLTALRRTRVGEVAVEQCSTIDALVERIAEAEFVLAEENASLKKNNSNT